MNSANAALVRFLAAGATACIGGCAQVSRPPEVNPVPAVIAAPPARQEMSPEAPRSDPAPAPAAPPVMIIISEAQVREPTPSREPQPSREEAANAAARQASLRLEIAEVRQRYVDAHPELPESVRLAILSQNVVPGMTRETAFVSLGAPERATKSVTSAGANEQWTYPGRTLYFEKGILLSYTEEH